MTLTNQTIGIIVEEAIRSHYERTDKKWPTPWAAILWAVTELGEACENILPSMGDWARNNPDNHPKTFEKVPFGEELGDAIMMLLVAGYRCGVDPLESMLNKVEEAKDELQPIQEDGSEQDT